MKRCTSEIESTAGPLVRCFLEQGHKDKIHNGWDRDNCLFTWGDDFAVGGAYSVRYDRCEETTRCYRTKGHAEEHSNGRGAHWS